MNVTIKRLNNRNIHHLLILTTTMLMALGSVALAAHSHLNVVWFDHQYDQLPLKKVLVIGVTEDPRQRERFETALTKAIRDRGGKAEASFKLLPGIQDINRESVKNAIKGTDFDSILACRLISIQLNTSYQPEPGENSFDVEYQRMYGTVVAPGHLADSKTVALQIRIFSTDGKKIWSAESETFNSANLEDLIRSIAGEVRKDLSAKGFLKH